MYWPRGGASAVTYMGRDLANLGCYVYLCQVELNFQARIMRYGGSQLKLVTTLSFNAAALQHQKQVFVHAVNCYD